MKKNIFEIVEEILKTNLKYLSDDGKLLKAKVYSDIMRMDKELLCLLLSNEKIKERFFEDINGTLIFDKQKFAWFIESKEFLPDSYTRYTNKIGLTHGGNFISKSNDVVLDFPYKDCVLEGGQDKEDQKRKEIFYNETIASDEIGKMLAPKVFTNAKRYTKASIQENITFDENDNLIIKGNNLITLSSLLKRYEGQIKLIYIDPPYNTGSDTFSYNDSFNRSAWLAFMKNRLELAYRLLSPEGAIYVQLDYHQVHYTKVLMDEIFGEDNFQREIIWRIGWLSGYKTMDKNWIRNHDTILFYSKNNDVVKRKFNKHYIKNEEFKEYIDEPTLFKKLKEYGLNRENSKEIAQFINHDNRTDQYPIEDVWNGNEYDDLNSIAIVSFSGETVSKMLNPDDEVKGQKSEKLLERIISAHTLSGDIVVDFFGGTFTTGAVAHKMGRKFILCEQLDRHIDIGLRRLQKVIIGEQSGISRKYSWQGGGSFVYCELLENASTLIEKIQTASEETITEIKNEIYANENIVPYITRVELEKADEEFNSLELEEKKKILISLVNKNKLYVNYSDMDDESYTISESDKAFSKSFYAEV
jgi:DNA methylase N-4/N-6